METILFIKALKPQYKTAISEYKTLLHYQNRDMKIDPKNKTYFSQSLHDSGRHVRHPFGPHTPYSPKSK